MIDQLREIRDSSAGAGDGPMGGVARARADG